MPTPIDPKRLPALKAALEQFGEDDTIQHKDLATLYGVTPARLTTLIKNRFENFPPADRHGDKTHWYPARAAIIVIIAYLEGSGKAKRAAAARAQVVMGRATEAAAGAEPEEEELPPMGPVELDRMASAATRIWRLQVEQRKYVLASEVRHEVRAMLAVVKREVSGLPSVVDPNGELPPLMRARLEARCREAQNKIYEQLTGLLADEGDDDADG
jgi:hypothetical protein